jgi:general secretion pathway protein K
MTRSKRRQQGSVLIIVLILMMISVSLALYTVSVSREITKTSAQLLDNLQARLESGSALEKLKYIGSTGRFTSWNLENLSGNKDFPLQLNLRDNPLTVGNCELRLQDSAGKLSLWYPHYDILKNLLLAKGVSSADSSVANDSLMDWIDEDDLKRLNGAESYYYKMEQSRPYGARNDRFLQTTGELALVKGFQGQVYDLVKDEMLETVTGSFNFNTADANLLSAVLGTGLQEAQSLVQLREKKGILLPAELIAAGGNGLTLTDDYFSMFPSMKVAVTIASRINEAGDSVRAIVSFRPGKERPFTVEKFEE